MAFIITQSFSFLDWADYAMQMIWLWAMTLSNVSNNFDYGTNLNIIQFAMQLRKWNEVDWLTLVKMTKIAHTITQRFSCFRLSWLRNANDLNSVNYELWFFKMFWINLTVSYGSLKCFE